MVALLTLNVRGRLEEYFELQDGNFDKKEVGKYPTMDKGHFTCNRDLTSIWNISQYAVMCHRKGGKDTKSTKPTEFEFLELDFHKHHQNDNAFVLDDGTLITYWEPLEGIIKIIAFKSNENGKIEISSEDSFADTNKPSFCPVCNNQVSDFIHYEEEITYRLRGIVKVKTTYEHEDCQDPGEVPVSYSEIQTDTSPPIQQYLAAPEQAEWNGYKTDEDSFDLGDRGTLVCTRKWKNNQSTWDFQSPQARTVGLKSKEILGITNTFNTNSNVTVSNKSLEDRVGFLETVISDIQGTLQNLMDRLP